LRFYQLLTQFVAPKRTELPGQASRNIQTIDNMGPFTIPQKGFKIELDPKNYAIYEKVINENEGNKIQLLNNKVLINGKVADEYTFKKNYYFVMGDNRQLALDSRFLGFIPEDHIEGKVQCVIYSNNFFLNFGRMLKQIK
jgi:signal peptidase I